MYRIRKNPNWWISASSGNKTLWIIFIIFPLLRSALYISSEINLSNPSDLLNIVKLIPALFSIPFLIIWIQQYKKQIKIDKAKKFKETGWWILKKIQITSIEHYETSSDDNRKWFSWYYAEAREWDMIYCSDAYAKWHRWWTSTSVLEELYQSYWFEYDKNETHKQDVLREYDKRIAEKRFESENWWFFKKLIAKCWLYFTKDQREIIEKWYEPQYREVNWNRITVWDIVDVYIDPDDDKNYWMDIDFLFEK